MGAGSGGAAFADDPTRAGDATASFEIRFATSPDGEARGLDWKCHMAFGAVICTTTVLGTTYTCDSRDLGVTWTCSRG